MKSQHIWHCIIHFRPDSSSFFVLTPMFLLLRLSVLFSSSSFNLYVFLRILVYFIAFFNADKIRVRSVLCHHTLLHHTLCHWELLFFVSVCLSFYFWVVTPALFIMQPISRSAHHKAPSSLVSLGGMSRERPSNGIMQAEGSQWFSSGFVLWFSWVSQSDGRRVAHSLLYWMFEGRLKKQKEIITAPVPHHRYGNLETLGWVFMKSEYPTIKLVFVITIMIPKFKKVLLHFVDI